jgi:hypothetical protein
MPVSEHPLAAWESFYVIVGSSGAALIGLQFVVITLIAEMRPRFAIGSISAFGTPTVVHLGGALVVSAIMSAPWHSITGVTVALAIAGFAGLIYGLNVIFRARRQTQYVPVWEDWLWHVILPGIIYGLIAIAALLLGSATQFALFGIAGAALGLLLVGIHNAWDTVIYIVANRNEGGDSPEVR